MMWWSLRVTLFYQWPIMPSKDSSNGALVTHCLACSITVCIYFEAFTLRFDVTYRHLAEYGVVFNIKLTVCKYMNLNCRNEHCETNVQYFEIKVDHFLLNPLSFNKEIVCWWFIDISWSIQKEWIYCVCNILELLSFFYTVRHCNQCAESLWV